jgi:IS5 family transposase
MGKPRYEYRVNARVVSKKAAAPAQKAVPNDGTAFSRAVHAAPQPATTEKANHNAEKQRQLGIHARAGRVVPIALLGIQQNAAAVAVAPTRAEILAESEGPEPTLMGYFKAFRKKNP